MELSPCSDLINQYVHRYLAIALTKIFVLNCVRPENPGDAAKTDVNEGLELKSNTFHVLPSYSGTERILVRNNVCFMLISVFSYFHYTWV